MPVVLVSSFFFFFCVPYRSFLPLDFQPSAGYEIGCYFKVRFWTPELVLQGSSLRPQFDSEVMMEGAILQGMLWGV